ncbi:MAG: hypothetical protein AUJ92_03300 [Armatimonadetes bacterium CG2_30_59_28]|nr:ribbon-helix-helix protein, CopG family [Armatimonadota bacterium]OIO97600.1 MAG: hypothetical protein AUJ92_03300 [Armatimonadetes bacterium CG2_30_59_28]PIU66070.1 MAG: hypothetical protein COS85_06180 [Armatimonadetes bacterium CG07_land_8_20_14_0_80_59_28]PIX38370.1 MAG: hypothetical protein COZ56_20605 [Armatimonadetes bacterium CG_4_8_14_3_um_filter_58_9]PIY45800.1 MAG: hypothetical protein COZ05_06235 [Armatimonadetes bacterium CG_4_10_14_3_um_filter_59_10]PJB73814.1 MAG: hypothetica
MPYVNLQLPDGQLTRTDELARELGQNRSSYIRQAIERYNEQTARQLLSNRYKRASQACRQDSLRTCREFEVADSPLEPENEI